MRIKFLLYILLFTIIIAARQGMAQSMSDIKNIKVSQLSDDQVIAAWEKLQSTGLPEQDIYKLMAQQGVAPLEILAFKDRVTLLGINKQASKVFKKPAVIAKTTQDTTTKPKPILPPPAQVITSTTLSVYGSEFFTQQAKSFESNFNIAMPKGYVLGPGDKMTILLTGLNEKTTDVTVGPSGNIQIQYGGLVNVNGFTIEQATTLIKNKLLKVYPALSSGQTQLTINLSNARTIKVIITGEVKTPGSYTISSLSTLFNVLYNSGGPNQIGSLRNIRIIRNHKIYRTVDLYTFLQEGFLTGNVKLEDQDVIQIPVYKKRVSIIGEVKRPAIYELKEDEKLSDLINYAGGYTDIAYTGAAKVDQINALQREVKDISANIFSNYTPHNGDVVEIGPITNRYTNRVVLEGSVYRPGVYELSSGFTLAQLLKKSEGIKPEAYTESGYIKRTLPNLERSLIAFKPADILSGQNDVPLLREDTVVIMEKSVFISNQTVTIQGYVRKPSIIGYRKGLKLADVIAMAGGFADEAADHHIEIERVIKNESDVVANQLVTTLVVNMDDINDANRNIELQPKDVVNVRRLVNDHGLGNVIIQGEVVFPGVFAVQKRDETALEFLQRAGGVTPYGSLENTQVYRAGVRVNLDLINKNNDIEANKKMILLPGDSVYVPRVISYVEVAGAVNNPQYISYKGGRFKYYINAAAGVTENARLKGSYIQYPDGLNKPTRHFLFFRSYPKVKPGSKIIVPEKSLSKLKIGFGDLGGIAAALTALVSIVAILSKK